MQLDEKNAFDKELEEQQDKVKKEAADILRNQKKGSDFTLTQVETVLEALTTTHQEQVDMIAYNVSQANEIAVKIGRYMQLRSQLSEKIGAEEDVVH